MNESFPEISQLARRQIMETGFEFLQSLVQAYGDDRANDVWEAVTDAIDPNIRHEMLIEMLKSVNVGRSIIVEKVNESAMTHSPNSGLIESIKALRIVTGFGLKEAKDFVCDVRDNNRPLSATISPAISRYEALRIMRAAGCTAS